jgi:retron-type reverse transcriptase
MVTVLDEIYEVDFRSLSYGFRPERNPHEALEARNAGLQEKLVNLPREGGFAFVISIRL